MLTESLDRLKLSYSQMTTHTAELTREVMGMSASLQSQASPCSHALATMWRCIAVFELVYLCVQHHIPRGCLQMYAGKSVTVASKQSSRLIKTLHSFLPRYSCTYWLVS